MLGYNQEKFLGERCGEAVVANIRAVDGGQRAAEAVPEWGA